VEIKRVTNLLIHNQRLHKIIPCPKHNKSKSFNPISNVILWKFEFKNVQVTEKLVNVLLLNVVVKVTNVGLEWGRAGDLGVFVGWATGGAGRCGEDYSFFCCYEFCITINGF
jgi:hypothetical protein